MAKHVFADSGKRARQTPEQIARLATDIVEVVVRQCSPVDATLVMATALRLTAAVVHGAVGSDAAGALWDWAMSVAEGATVLKERISTDAPPGAPADPFELPSADEDQDKEDN